MSAIVKVLNISVSGNIEETETLDGSKKYFDQMPSNFKTLACTEAAPGICKCGRSDPKVSITISVILSVLGSRTITVNNIIKYTHIRKSIN